MGFPHAGAPISAQVCSATRVFCPDCRASIGLFAYEPLPWARRHSSGLLDVNAAEVALTAHAYERPILHPTVLPRWHAALREGRDARYEPARGPAR